MQRFAQEPAYVLHGRPFRETSLIIEVFSRTHGRQGIVARGARGARSRWRNILQPFRPLLLNWNQRGELGTLTGADQVASTPPLAGEPLLCGLYANELLMRMLQRSDPHPELFEGYQRLLTCLTENQGIQKHLRLFERDLLQSLGFGLQLVSESGSGADISADSWYVYKPESGAAVQQVMTQQNTPVKIADGDGDGAGGGPGGANPQSLIRGESLLALASGDIQTHHLRELKMLMRGLIRYHLGDKPLVSHSLFRN